MVPPRLQYVLCVSLRYRSARIEDGGYCRNNTPVLGNPIPVLGVKPKRGYYVFWLFFKIGACSGISFKRSRRELSIDVAEHRSILKNVQNTPVLFLPPKQLRTPLVRNSVVIVSSASLRLLSSGIARAEQY